TMDPVEGDVFPRPERFIGKPQDFAFCMRIFAGLSQVEWIRRSGLTEYKVQAAEHERGRGYTSEELRTIHENVPELLPRDVLDTPLHQMALDQFSPVNPADYDSVGGWLRALRESRHAGKQQVGTTKLAAAAEQFNRKMITDFELDRLKLNPLTV